MGNTCSSPKSSTGKDCIFCSIVAGEASTRVIYEDSQVVAFKDIKPAASAHFLIIPKEHIPNTRSLRPLHVPLLRHMQAVGEKLLTEADASAERKLGYHKPPFRSVDHLHLHCLTLPFQPAWKALKYRCAINWWASQELITSLSASVTSAAHFDELP